MVWDGALIGKGLGWVSKILLIWEITVKCVENLACSCARILYKNSLNQLFYKSLVRERGSPKAIKINVKNFQSSIFANITIKKYASFLIKLRI